MKSINISSSIEMITPALARLYLDKNTRNRPIKSTVVSRYALEMKEGNWEFTHQGIAFDSEGVLLDGQHRLEAIMLSGSSVPMLVTRGIKSESQLIMDDHAKRNTADALSLARCEKISIRHVSIIRASSELCASIKGKRRLALTKNEVNLAYDVFRPSFDFLTYISPVDTRGVTTAPVLAAVCLAFYYVPNLKDLIEFCNVFFGKKHVISEDQRTAIQLREFLLKNSGGGGYAGRAEAFLKTQRAIYAYTKREKLSRLVAGSIYYDYPLKENIRSVFEVP